MLLLPPGRRAPQRGTCQAPPRPAQCPTGSPSAATYAACHLLCRVVPSSLLPTKRGNDTVSAVSYGVAALRCCCRQRATTLPPAALRPSVAATADAWRQCCRYRVICRQSAATLPSLISPPRHGNQPSLPPLLPSPAAWRHFVAAIADVWRQCRCCGVLWRGDPQLLVPTTRGDAGAAAISVGHYCCQRCNLLWRGGPPLLLPQTRGDGRPSVAALDTNTKVV